MEILKGALCLEGGSLRGIFTAGVLDALLDNKLYIEYVMAPLEAYSGV